jgi:transposase
LCRQYRIRLIFLPPYTPEFNPIELAFGTLKTYLKGQALVLHGTQLAHLHILDAWARQLGPHLWTRFIQNAGYPVPTEVLQ